jgi:hypothetical protein
MSAEAQSYDSATSSQQGPQEPPEAKSFGSSRVVDIAVSGQRLRVTDDPYSDRVRCDHPNIEDGRALGRGLTAAADLMGRGRVVVLADQRSRRG